MEKQLDELKPEGDSSQLKEGHYTLGVDPKMWLLKHQDFRDGMK